MGTLTEFVRAYITEGVATGRFNRTGVEAVRYHLQPLCKWFGNRPLERLTRGAILKWLESIAHLAATTRRAYLVCASGFTKWLHINGHLKTDPCDGIPRPKVPRGQPRALHSDHVAACLQACTDDRDRAIIWLAVGLGLRRAEMAAVRWTDYDDTAQLLRVVGKGGHERVIPVTEPVAKALEKIRGPWHAPILPRYAGADGQPLSVRMISQIVNRIVTDAGVKVAPWDGVGCHSFRHTAATDVLDNSGDLRAVQQLLGHSNLSTTSVYLGLASLPSLRAAMEGRDYTATQAEVRNIA